MIYISKWERLSDSIDRLVRINTITQEEAQTDLCCAIADGEIKIRAKLNKQASGLMVSKQVLDGTCFNIPTDLRPNDFDWEKSRPLQPWEVRRGTFRLPGRWHLAWLELGKSDVTNLPCPVVPDAPTASTTKIQTRKRKSRRAYDSALEAIKKLYPDGVRDQMKLPNGTLCQSVGAELKNMGLPDVSDDTILRAADRRK